MPTDKATSAKEAAASWLTPCGAAAWCLGYGALGGYWALGGAEFPFGAGDPRGAEMGSWLATATPRATGAAIAAGCVAGLVAILAARHGLRRLPAAVLLALVAPLMLVVPDVRVLQNLAYALHGYVGLVDWPVLNQVLCGVGGALLAGTAAQMLRRPRCPECGRARANPAERRRWTRIGRWATAVAVAAPLPYAVQRAAWNLGVPLGVDRRFVAELTADFHAKGVGPLLAYSLPLSAVGGALLTLGLSMRWGEVFPRWLPYLGGRRVPVTLAVVPATVASVAVTVAGLAIARWAILDGTIGGGGLPGLLWLPWGLALGVSTLAYRCRRRDTCGPDRDNAPRRGGAVADRRRDAEPAR
jgi:hypothetical protein